MCVLPYYETFKRSRYNLLTGDFIIILLRLLFPFFFFFSRRVGVEIYAFYCAAFRVDGFLIHLIFHSDIAHILLSNGSYLVVCRVELSKIS